MKRLFNTKKRVALLVSLVVVGAAAFGAYAFYNNTGGGTDTGVVGIGGSATGTFGTDFLLKADGTTAIAPSYKESNAGVSPCTNTAVTVTKLYPTSATDCNAVVETIPFTLTNTSEASEQLNGWTAQVTGLTTGCSAADFSVGGEATPGTLHSVSITPVVLAPASDGAASKYDASVTVEMINSGLSQNGCIGQTPDLTITAS